MLQVIKKLFQLPAGESISPTPDSIMKRRLQEKRELQLQDDTNFSWTYQKYPESLLNKQLYSNQDVIYREQVATFLLEIKSMHAYSYSKEMRMSDFLL